MSDLNADFQKEESFAQAMQRIINEPEETYIARLYEVFNPRQTVPLVYPKLQLVNIAQGEK